MKDWSEDFDMQKLICPISNSIVSFYSGLDFLSMNLKLPPEMSEFMLRKRAFSERFWIYFY